MSLSGTLGDFGLPDVFSLLSATKKTGTLHLRHGAAHGVVHLRDGQVTGARADVRREALSRRLVGAGLVDDGTLTAAVALADGHPTTGLARLLAERVGLDPDTGRELAAEQAVDAVFDLMRWPEGAFTFELDELDPDDLGAALPVEALVAEVRRRLDAWERLSSSGAAQDAVVSFAPAPAQPPVLTPAEWQLLSLVDGRRPVAELVRLSGRGSFEVMGTLAALAERSLVLLGDRDGADGLLHRDRLLAELEGRTPAPPAPPTGAPGAAAAEIDRTLLLRLVAGVKGR